MKKLFLLTLGVCALTLTLPTSVLAKGKHKANADKASADAGVAFAKYDTNGNGILDPDEKDALRKAFDTDKSLKVYDTNNDGKLSDDEIAAIKPATTGKKGKKNKSQ